MVKLTATSLATNLGDVALTSPVLARKPNALNARPLIGSAPMLNAGPVFQPAVLKPQQVLAAISLAAQPLMAGPRPVFYMLPVTGLSALFLSNDAPTVDSVPVLTLFAMPSAVGLTAVVFANDSPTLDQQPVLTCV